MVKANDYDLILMDLQMPVMDGYKATSKIRNLENPRFKTIPIIALSATDRIEIEAQIRKAGMNDFLSKPFAPKQLKEILVRYLRR
jgi:CheY-like chemotaxis protein